MTDIDGLSELLGDLSCDHRRIDPGDSRHVDAFTTGNIILGGDGSDIIDGPRRRRHHRRRRLAERAHQRQEPAQEPPSECRDVETLRHFTVDWRTHSRW